MKNRILFITPALTKAGAETQLIKLAQFLKSEMNDVLVISLLPQGTCDINMDRAGLDAVYLKSWRTNFFSNLLQLHREVKAFNPEVTVAFMFIAIIFARLLKLFFNFSLVSSIRAAEIPKKWLIPFRLTSRFDDAVVYNSKFSKKSFEEQKLIRKGGFVINNAITIPAGSVHLSREAADPFHWVCIAHFRIEKDYQTLFKAVALLKKENFVVDIVGHLYDQQWPKEMLRDLQIEDKVFLQGFRTNATDYLQKADGFVMSSFTESTPNAVLEAMAHAKPVVATGVGGVKDLVRSSNCGFCTNLRDPYCMAIRMAELMKMPSAEREELGQNGRKYVEQNFSERIVMNSWLSVINRFRKIDLPAAHVA
ncbi:glycosyltransferase family 4 protein [Pedobacter sp. SYSU D00535]|uniref:glycosyltransferase family 4 protein n=1 Tax=Pedobacter sp. SYSU D00535 TaxID=2810308 RepID=UPI001A97CBB6|nr:glycosyltransferase family 4 protein [Pedobacter sp. SYSU D00535]